MYLFAFLVGFVSLGFQFVYNRLIFFYLTNSDYATATVISIYLLGFLIGSGVAKLKKTHGKLSLPIITLAYLASAVISYGLNWVLGLDIMPVAALITSFVFFSLITAFCAGYSLLVLVQSAKAVNTAAAIYIVDTIGSVLGAVVAGFIFIPQLGISLSFDILIALLALMLGVALLKEMPPRIAMAGVLAVTLLFAAGYGYMRISGYTAGETRVQGYPLPQEQQEDLVKTLKTPYGVLSVFQVDKSMRLYIDAIILCSADGSNYRDLSEWRVGELPAKLASGIVPAPRGAVIGLGCGITLASTLENMPPQGQVEVIDINKGMPEMAALFSEYTGDVLNDPRVKITIEDGFNHFLKKHEAPYDFVVLDVVWMQSANVTHLFSKEMFKNIKNSMPPHGVFSIWSDEDTWYSEVSQTMLKTMQKVYPYVWTQYYGGMMLFFATSDEAVYRQAMETLSAEDKWRNHEVRIMASDSPVNTLDDLVISRQKFTAKEMEDHFLYGLNKFNWLSGSRKNTQEPLPE